MTPLLAALLAIGQPAATPPPATVAPAAAPDAREILQRAIDAAGGETWLNPRTLVMRGRAVFYGPDSPAPRTIADDYRMWRFFNPGRTISHGADGMVRIRARAGAQTIFEVGYDGATTWNERGIVPAAEAEAYWAANFGFGIIRQAFRPGFTLTRVPDGEVDGHPVFKLRLAGPDGQQTLFGIDQASLAIRSIEFATPRGWHMRTYDDFVELQNPRWLQARKVTLYYNGIKQNEVYWTDVQVNVSIDPASFRAPL